MWVAWQGHATQPSYFQSPAPATQKSGMRPKVLHLPHKYHRFFYPICNSDCCHDILHPFSYCQPMSWAYEKVVLAETVTMPFVSVRDFFFNKCKDFLYHQRFNNFVLEGLNAPNEVVECCHDTKNLPGLKRRALSQSLPALLFRTLRTLADSRKKDAKYNGSNLNYKLDKKNDGICVAGAALWDACCSFVWQTLGFGSMMVVLRGPAMQLTCNTHATHSQHNTQHEHFSCKFSMNVRISRGWPRIRSLNANVRFWHTTRTLIENLQEKCSCCVLCWLCVACVLHVSCMAGPRNTTIILPKPSACHTKEQHASQSAAPATQIPSFFLSNL